MNFPRFQKIVSSLELLKYIPENSSPKGSFSRNKRKSEFSELSLDSPYLLSVALKIAGALDVAKSAEDINISHKIKSDGAGTILLKFQSHRAKSRLCKARTKLKNLRLTDIFTDLSTATLVAARTGRIFINVYLTSYKLISGLYF